jgi:hypothetical protein
MFCSSAIMMPLPVTPNRTSQALVTSVSDATTSSPLSLWAASRRRLVVRASISTGMPLPSFRGAGRSRLL